MGFSAPLTSLANCSLFAFVASSSIGAKPVPATVLPGCSLPSPLVHCAASLQVRSEESPNTFTTAAAASSLLAYLAQAPPVQLLPDTLEVLVTGNAFIML
ncbi:hypothetical protein D3C80_1940700 [compost metagenome]